VSDPGFGRIDLDDHEGTPARFLGESDADAIAAGDALLRAGLGRPLAERVFIGLMGEDSWLRERVLERLRALSDTRDLLPHLAAGLHDEARADRRNAARSALAALAVPGTEGAAAAAGTLGELVTRSPDVDVRLLAANALGESGNPAGRAALESALLDVDTNVAAAAAESLGLLGDTRALPALLAAAEFPDGWVRSAAVMALGRLGDPSANGLLERLLSDPGVGPAAADAIAQIGSPTGLEALRPALEGPPSARRWAIRPLARLFGRNPGLAVPEWLRPVVQEEIRTLLDGAWSDPTVEEARLLGIAGTEHAASALLDLLQVDDREEIARAGLELLPPRSLGRVSLERLRGAPPERRATLLELLPPPAVAESVAEVVNALGSDDVSTRTAAAGLLGRSDPALVIPLLAEAARSEHHRTGVAMAYGQLSTPPLAELVALLGSPDPDVRCAAAGSLGAAGDAARAPIVVALESETDPGVRDALIGALGRTGGAWSVGALVDLLRNDSSRDRFSAAVALGRLGETGALDPLLEALGDPAPEVRIAALRAIGDLGDPRAAPEIERHLATGDREVRRVAVRALDRVDHPQRRERLASALFDPDREVRLTSVGVLRRIAGDSERVALERRAGEEHDPEVRRAITRALVELNAPAAEP
jgi:HEAT repeat protein